MLCPVCGRAELHCRHCHFVHDHMNLLDGTLASNNQLRHRPAPWKISPIIRRQVMEAAVGYQPR